MNKLDTLLLVSESAEHRMLLRSILSQSYNLLEAGNTQQSLLLLGQNIGCIAAMIADISSSDDIEPDLKDVPEQVPLILICREDSPRILNQGFGLGAADVIPLDYDPDAMLHRIDTITHLHNHKLYLERMVEEQAQKLRSSNDTMVGALSSIIEYRSVESGQHVLRIRHFTKLLLEEVRRSCPEYRLTDEIISVIASASALHDIGKIAIPDAILMKPGKLTDEERAVMQTHAITGCRILETLQDVGNEDYLRYAHNICHYHHERWDGKGYPEGLEGDAIPICAQVVGLADVYDALTSKRVYKDAYSFDTAVNMILKGACGLFSPKLLECFKHVSEQFKAVAHAYSDGLSPKTETFDVTLPQPAPDDNLDSLNRVQGKYLCLLHYLNCFVLELSVDQGHYHLRYNPYPELALISQASSLPQMAQLVLDQLVIPEERQRMQALIQHDLEEYLRAGLRRQSFRFHFRGRDGKPELYDVTLLRANVNQTSNRSLAVLCRRITKGEERLFSPAVPDSFAAALSGYTLCCRNDRDFTLVTTGRDTHTLAGYTPEEVHAQFDGKLLSLIHPDDREEVLCAVRDQLNLGTAIALDFRMLHKDGSVRWLTCQGRLILEQEGRECLSCLLTDVSHLRHAHDELQQKLDRYDIILAQTENVLFDWDIPSDTISFSNTWEKIFGYSPISGNFRSALIDNSFIHPDDAPLLLDAIASIENGSGYEMAEVRVATSRGRYLWCRFRASALRSQLGTLEKICGIIINIDAEKQAERDLQERAERDALTKLLNKQTARKQAEEYLALYPKGVHCAMLIIDLDNFKQVNDQFGHLFGDAVLTQTARLIRKMFRIQDILARIGGDEFLVLMRGISDPNLLKNRCQRLIAEISQFSRSQLKDLSLSCSIGIALSPQHGSTYYELFQHADQALYQAKALGKNQHVLYSPRDAAFQSLNSRLSAINNRIDSDNEPGLADNSLVQYAFHRLYSSSDVAASVNEILSIVGQKLNVSRVYIFENSDDNRFCSNTYEWCNHGISPEIQNLQNISYATDIPNYEDNFNEQGIFYCPNIHDLPKSTYDIVAPQGIKSMLHCAIRENGVFRGYIGFDECVEHRMWTKDQIQMLSYFSDMLSVFLLKKREQDKALRTADELRSILDNQNAWIYIIDPDTFRLKYLNARTRTLASAACAGMLCHKALMGSDTPCPGCPAVNIRQLKNNSTLMPRNAYGISVLADAALISWAGQQACLLTCRQSCDTVSLADFAPEGQM